MPSLEKIPSCGMRCQLEARTIEYGVEHIDLFFIGPLQWLFLNQTSACMMEVSWTYRMISGSKFSMCFTRRKCEAQMWGISTQPSVFSTFFNPISINLLHLWKLRPRSFPWSRSNLSWPIMIREVWWQSSWSPSAKDSCFDMFNTGTHAYVFDIFS